jgi:tetratricopeptide (TPR) repeat protein
VGLFLADRLEEALPIMERVAALNAKALGSDHSVVLLEDANIGTTLDKLGRPSEAEPHFRNAVRGLDKVLGPTHCDTISIRAGWARVLRELGKPDEALEVTQGGVEVCSRNHACEARVESESLREMGSALVELGRSAEAVALLERGLQLGVAHQVEEDDLADTRFALAKALWAVGHDRVRARSLAAEAQRVLGGLRRRRDAPVVAWLEAHPEPHR